MREGDIKGLGKKDINALKEGTLPNFSSIFPFFSFSPFRKVKMEKKKHQIFPIFP